MILGLETLTMKNLEKQFSKDLAITRSSNLVREYSDSIPIDLLIDIFSRVDGKSIARFRCVSKLWESIFRRPYFTELFLSKSMTRPRFLFTFEVDGELLVFSSPQPRNPDNNSPLVATRYKCFPKYFPSERCSPVFGLVSLKNRVGNTRVVCNLVTGESITLPKLKKTDIGYSLFGYDPINKHYKVLCIPWSRGKSTHRILTLEYGKRVWRTIQNPMGHHCKSCNEICINGVLYYKASFEGYLMIVCFDFGSEEFSFINLDEDMIRDQNYNRWTLFNYKGKLGVHEYRNERKEFVLWVLEDAEKQKWFKSSVGVLDKQVYGHKIVGMTDTGEIVFSPTFISNPFYLLYYNIDRNTFTRVQVQGFEDFEQRSIIFINVFLDYVENLKFM